MKKHLQNAHPYAQNGRIPLGSISTATTRASTVYSPKSWRTPPLKCVVKSSSPDIDQLELDCGESSYGTRDENINNKKCPDFFLVGIFSRKVMHSSSLCL